ncbi:MAG: winged helix-turn-helix domain-containing protein [Desulfurococcaceae archaeon]
MITARLKKIISLLGEEFALEDITLKAGISPRTAKKYLSEMIKLGIVTKISDNKYALTEEGSLILEGSRVKEKIVEDKYSYVFTDENGAPVPVKFDSIEKLYVILKYKLVPENIVLHHLRKEYLTKWLADQLGAKVLARKLITVNSTSELIKLLEEYIYD